MMMTTHIRRQKRILEEMSDDMVCAESFLRELDRTKEEVASVEIVVSFNVHSFVDREVGNI